MKKYYHNHIHYIDGNAHFAIGNILWMYLMFVEVFKTIIQYEDNYFANIFVNRKTKGLGNYIVKFSSNVKHMFY